MTRAEFIDTVNEWWELIDFCSDENCEICNDVYSDDDRDSYIDERLSDIADSIGDWRSLRDELYNITTGYDYYLYNGWTDWIGLTDEDFEEFKQRVLVWMDNGDYWEEEEDEEEYFEEEFFDDEYYDEDDEDWFEDEPIPSDIDTQEFENLIVG